MKLFGEFLVEKGVVKSGDLAATLIKQFKELPSLPEVVWDLKLLTPEQFLTVFKTQIDDKCEFKTAAIKANFWQQDFDTQVESFLQSKRTPIGQLLVQDSILDVPTLTKQLDEYLAVVSKEAKEKGGKTPVTTPTPISPAPVTAVKPIQTSTKLDFQCTTLSDDNVADITRFFSEARKLEVHQWLMSFQKDDVGQLIQFLYTVKGTAQFAGAVIIESIASRFEQFLSTKKFEDITANEMEYKSWAAQTIDYLWQLKECIEKTKSEAEFWDQSLNKSGVTDFLNQFPSEVGQKEAA